LYSPAPNPGFSDLASKPAPHGILTVSLRIPYEPSGELESVRFEVNLSGGSRVLSCWFWLYE